MIDFAIAASWTEYRRDQISLKKSNKEMLDLLSFRIEIQEYLLNVEQSISSSDYEAEEPTAKKFRGRVPHPSDHFRQKGTLHLPMIPTPAKKIVAGSQGAMPTQQK